MINILKRFKKQMVFFVIVCFVMLQMPVTVWADEDWEKHWENKGVWWLGDEDEDQPNVEGVRLGASARAIVAEFYQDWARLNVDTWINGNLTVYDAIDTEHITSIANILIEADNDSMQPGSENITLRASGTNAVVVTSTNTTVNNTLRVNNIATIGTSETDLNLSAREDVIINSDSNAGGGGNVIIQKGGSTIATFATGSTSLTGTLGVSGQISGSGGLSLENFAVADNTGNTSIGGTLGVTGATTLSGNFSANGTTNNIGTTQASTNSIGTYAGSTTTIGNTTGSTGITGNSVSINTSNTAGLTTTIGSTNASAGTVTIQSNTNRLTVNNTSTQLVSTGATLGTSNNTISGNANGATLSMSDNNVSLTNSTSHGLTVTGTTTTLTGGTNSSAWTLQDGDAGGATLTVSGSGGGTTHTLFQATTDVTGTTSGVTIGTAGNTVNTIQGLTNNMAATGVGSSNNITGTTNINVNNNTATNINTGTSTAAVTIGNSANTTFLNSATNNIGVSSSYATVNNIGTNNAFSSTNTIGNTNSSSTVSAYGGAGYMTLTNGQSTLGTTGGANGGGMVQTTASTATIRASNSGSLASNGTTGVMVLGSGGGYTTHQTPQTVASGTTIGNILNGVQYTNQINGNLLVDGNVYINGTLNYVSSNAANTTVVGGDSVLPNATQTTSGGTAIVLKDQDALYTTVDAKGRLTNVNGIAPESTASLTLTNGYGETHGIVVTERQTTISGGTRSTSLTLNDSGATFRNTTTGGPVRVTGVADGKSDFDAVNYRQLKSELKKVYSGVASVAALAAIPDPAPGKRFSIGTGYGYYEGESAIALGVKAAITDRINAHLGVGYSRTRVTTNAGVGYSW